MSVGQQFRVIHQFKAEEPVELSVDRGEVLRALDAQAHDGWMKVAVCADPSRSGFVPVSYIREVSQTPTRGDSHRSKTSTAPRAASMRSPSTNHIDLHQTSADHSPALTGQPITPAQASAGAITRSLLEKPESVVEAFMKNEVYYKQLMQRRADALRAVQSGLEDAVTALAVCKDRNGALTRKLRDFDEVVEKEQQRWRESVAEEKSYINRSAAYKPSADGGAQSNNGSLLGYS